MQTKESAAHNNYLEELRVIYIVGNSRSGTTMLSRIFNNHSSVYSLPELHFFERYDAFEKADANKLKLAVIYLLRIIKNGFYDNSPAAAFEDEALQIIKDYSPSDYASCYTAVLHHTSILHKADYICEQTPQNIFYTDIIKQYIPNSYFIHIVRDPRDVLLSQKRKWRRASQGASFIPLKETIRAFFNYHPYTISKIWHAVIRKSLQANLTTIRYEELLAHPQEVLQKLCNICQITYEPGMEQVPIVGSSSSKDSGSIGLNKERLYAWKRGGLNSAELFICNFINQSFIIRFGYDKPAIFPNLFFLLAYLIYFPLHILFAIVMNVNRQRNILSAIKRRLLQ